MTNEPCAIQFCRHIPYAPAGTGFVCKLHFADFLTWRRKRGLQMFMKYAGMTMTERDSIVEEWKKTVKVEEALASAPSKG